MSTTLKWDEPIGGGSGICSVGPAGSHIGTEGGGILGCGHEGPTISSAIIGRKQKQSCEADGGGYVKPPYVPAWFGGNTSSLMASVRFVSKNETGGSWPNFEPAPTSKSTTRL